MTHAQATQMIDGLLGWTDPQIGETEWGTIYVTAVDPTDGRRKRYDESTGYFVD